jgi:sigma-B regulation protein RsbU (phosphoserine phosphatase)
VSAEAQVASLLRREIANIVAGAFFLFICMVALSIAAIRPRRSARLLVWLAVWSGMFGAQELLWSRPVAESLPASLQVAREPLLVVFAYFIIVAATFSCLDLTLGALRRLMQVLIVADVAVAVAGVAMYAVSGSQNSLLVYNELLTVILLAALVLTLSIPSLSRRFLVVTRHRVLTVGSLIFAVNALWINLARGLDLNVPRIYNTLGFAIFLLSLGYTGVEIMVEDERRLLLLDDELAIARKLQFSILPEGLPEVSGLDIAAVYKPMSAVAGDFYEFLVGDERHVGFLVADVSGHGVPAALIASMIKVATQAASGYASDPAQVLGSVGSILSKNARGQLVTAAYLWIDMAAHRASYSAAGHPPLVHWRRSDGTFTRVESNGLVFGIEAVSEYPVYKFPLAAGDRLLLYTDGVTEPENQAGQQFGERRLEQVMRENQSRSGTELAERLSAEIRAWQPSQVAQQDDITLIVVDVVE